MEGERHARPLSFVWRRGGSLTAIMRFVPMPDSYALGVTLAPLAHGHYDPTVAFDGHEVWRAYRIDGEPVTTRYRRVRGGVEVRAWGTARDAALDQAPAVLGTCDDPNGYRPAHPLLRELHRRHPGLRMIRTGAIFEALIPAILEQKVTGREALTAWAKMVRRYGDNAPGPRAMKVAPPAPVLVALPYHAYHPFGVEQRRADTIRRACMRAGRMNEAASMNAEDARRRLRALPGIGVWTAAEVTRISHGDADCVSVGDFHLKNMVGWALAGEARATDERMMELLEPEAGHRGRAVRLLELSGIGAPKFGPRHRTRDISRL